MTIKIGKLTECLAILPTFNLNWIETSGGTIYYLQLGWIFWYIDITINKFIRFKSFDKVKPKFKVGDWIVQEGVGVYKVIEVCESWYEVVDNKDNHFSIGFDQEYMCHSWTIQDAKPGDVLVNGSNIFIFHYIDATRLMGYCHVNTDNGKFYDDIGKNECFCLIDAVVNPATKEQHDLLSQKMKEAGYEWNAEKKELKKIGLKFRVGDCIVDDCGYVWKIKEILNKCYRLEGADSGESLPTIEWANENFHLWTIQDAKDGDVIVRNIDILSICIFSHFSGIHNKFSSFLCHCGLEGEGLGQELSINGYHDNSENYVLANKEQRDLLFQKMKEAGYKWDAEKKEVKKIVSKKLDPDKVIEWIDEHVPTKFEDMQNYVKQFKKDFGL